MSINIEIPQEKLIDFCKKNKIKRLSFLGSVLRDDFGPESDVDVLVEFEPGTKVGLRFFEMEIVLTKILRRKVDLNTAGYLSPYFKDKVLAGAEVAYAA